MKKLAYLFPATLLAALALPACGDDTTAADTDGADTGSTTADSATMTSPTMTSPTEPTTTGPTTDPTTTTDPTIDPDSSSGEPAGCSIEDGSQCETKGDCDPGSDCVACFCVADPDNLCPQGWGAEGEYADCGNGDACGPGGGDVQSACVGDTESSVCLYFGCEELCDCPAPPEGFEDLLTCEDLFGPGGMLDDVGDCFLDCSSSACPDGMFCDGGVCFHGEEPPPPDQIPEYGDCVNAEGVCVDAGICLVDDPEAPTQGICSATCDGVGDCGDPGSGDAEVVCIPLNDDTDICALECDAETVCPDDMICGVYGLCTHAIPPVPGYADCASQADAVCGADESCVEVSTKAESTEVCAASGCMDATLDCPAVPETGDAPAACLNIDGEDGMECVLDCSGDQTCPDGAICSEGGYCAYPSPVTTFEEEFDGGVLPDGWVVQNVDGLTPNDGVAIVDDAWIVTNVIDGPNYWLLSTSWYTPAGQSDDWIISPAVTLGATAFLRWAARATDPGFPDGYEVYVVPSSVTEFTDFVGDGDPTAFLATMPTPVFSVAGESDELQFHEVDLAALATQEVHIAFRNNSDDMNLLLVDEIRVVE